jgi:hypothetical protein
VNSDAGSAVISWTSTPIITGVQATPLNASVAVSWDASDLGSLSGYRIYGGTTAAPTTLLATVGADVIGYTHTGLTNGTTYFYRISAIVTENGVTTETPRSADTSAVPTTLTTANFAATGAVQTFVVPAGVSWLQLDASGAQGGNGSTGVGGLGGRTQGALEVVPGETLYFYVGGAGGKPTGGWNGGGVGQDSHGGGGGATDVRRPFVVTNAALTSNVATLTTSTAHGFAVGNSVVVAGVGVSFNGTFAVTAVTTNTFSYAKTASNVASASATGAVFFGLPSLGLSRRVLVAGGGGGGGNTQFGGAGGGLIGGEGGNHSCSVVLRWFWWLANIWQRSRRGWKRSRQLLGWRRWWLLGWLGLGSNSTRPIRSWRIFGRWRWFQLHRERRCRSGAHAGIQVRCGITDGFVFGRHHGTCGDGYFIAKPIGQLHRRKRSNRQCCVFKSRSCYGYTNIDARRRHA